jgi:transposase
MTNPKAIEAVATRLTIGLDVGDRRTHLCVLDHETGEILEEGSFKTSEPVLRKRLSGYEHSRIALETGAHARWMAACLASMGHEVLVANARKLRLITDNDTKSDKLDACRLALLARADPRLLHPVKLRGRQAQADLAVLKAREALVQERTKLINHVRGVLKSFGAGLKKGVSSKAFAKAAADCVPVELGPALRPLLVQIAALTKAVDGYDKRIEELCDSYPETKLVRQVPGIGPITGLAFVLVLEDPSRFASGGKVGSYLGLRPRRSQSGDPEAERDGRRITKAGNRFLRKLMVTSAHYVIGRKGPDSNLQRWGLKLAEGGKSRKKRAVVAVARKLSVLLYTLWLNKLTYEPFYGNESAPAATQAA